MLMLILLHLLPPETAHAASLFGLKLGLGPRLKNKSKLYLKLFGKEIRNPIGLSAGADKEAAALPAWSKMGFGIVEVGTVTLNPRTGNPKPRMWRLPDGGVINWLGLPGHGLDPFIKNLAKFKKHKSRRDVCVGASIASPDGVLDEFKILAKAVAPYVDYITLNASCPNVAHEDHAAEDTAAEQIKAAKLGAGRMPVLVKLGPTHDAVALERMVKAALAAGVDGFVATNTVPFASRTILPRMTFDWPEAEVIKNDDRRSASLRERSPAASERIKVGGYSGPQLLQTSTWMVKEIRKHIPADMPVIGVGGIQSGEDAIRMFKSGATAIQLYTGLITHGPDLLNDIAGALRR
ncbi:MAG: dihydroorotate dehydrogenase 2 [Alphaproteobacteria bacterium]|nr:dihydroorotate dehydrogenase 2 [Alphaproteobacteria bacterium]